MIILNDNTVTENNFVSEIAKMRDYYETKLSPALNYLFSLGAPAPKELASIENVYPYFIVMEKATKSEMRDLLAKTEGEKYFEFNNPKYDVMRGDKYYFVNNKTKSDSEIERYIEEQVFIREFKGQLHRYLNVHRVVWDKIDEVKSHKKVRGADIVKYTTMLEGYAKTIGLIDGRIKQMGTYLATREKIAKSDTELAEFLEISGYRYETLNDTLDYIRHLWDMTYKYVDQALHQFEGLKSDVTNKSVNSLAIVTLVSAAVAVIELLTEEEPNFTVFGLAYFLILAVVGWLAQKLINYVSNRRMYEVVDVDYEKL